MVDSLTADSRSSWPTLGANRPKLESPFAEDQLRTIRIVPGQTRPRGLIIDRPAKEPVTPMFVGVVCHDSDVFEQGIALPIIFVDDPLENICIQSAG